jgi:hypothetical protein
MPGSVRPQDAPRLIRLRERLAGRWRRRRRRQVVFLALAFVAFAVAVSMGFDFLLVPGSAATRQTIEGIVLATPLAGALSFGVYAIWRFDRTARRARGARIRLHQVERRLASLRPPPDGVAGERPVA